MTRWLISTTILVGMTATAMAEPGGCLKYGAGGAVAGHFVGQGHAVLGAAGGCAVGSYKRHEAKKAEREAARSGQSNEAPAPTTQTQ